VRLRKAVRFGSAGLRVHLIAFALIVLLPAGLFSAWAVAEAVSGQRRTARAHLQDTARAVALAVESEFATRLGVLQAMAASPLIDGAGTDCRFHEWAAEVGRANGSWVAVSAPRSAMGYPQIVNTLRACGEPMPVGGPEEALDRVFGTGRPAIANLFRGHAAGRPITAVIAPVVRGGTVVMAAAIPIEPPMLTALLQQVSGSAGVTLSLIDQSHTVVARSRNAEQLVGTQVPAQTVAAAAANDQHGFLVATATDGRELAMGYARLFSAPGWTVIAGVAAGEYEKAWAGPATRLLSGAAIVFALVAGVGWIGARRLLHPIRSLTEAADAVGQDNVAATREAPLSGIAEFDRLAGSIQRARRVLVQEERRYRALAQAGTLTAWRADATGNLLEGRGWQALTGQEDEALRGAGWLEMLHPDDRARTVEILAAARAEGRPVDVEYRVRRADGGGWRWVRAKGVPVRASEDGPVEEWIGSIEDAHERRMHEERQALLAREVDHRAKNALAVVQAAVRLTRAPDIQSYAKAVEGRVSALARAHTALAEDHWVGANLRTLLEGELAPFIAEEEGGPRAALRGTSVAVPAMAAQPLGMAIHELATNAVKHGALSMPGGRVTVEWSLEEGEDERTLLVRWVETGGPVVEGPPERHGFGSRLLDGTLRQQLRGRVEMHWSRDGLVAEIRVPMRPAPGLNVPD
jgi:PAS domain S-box-containing protein